MIATEFQREQTTYLLELFVLEQGYRLKLFDSKEERTWGSVCGEKRTTKSQIVARVWLQVI